MAVHMRSQCCRDRDRWIPGACRAGRHTPLASSRPVRGFVFKKTNVDNVWGTVPKADLWLLQVPAHKYRHTLPHYTFSHTHTPCPPTHKHSYTYHIHTFIHAPHTYTHSYTTHTYTHYTVHITHLYILTHTLIHTPHTCLHTPHAHSYTHSLTLTCPHLISS